MKLEKPSTSQDFDSDDSDEAEDDMDRDEYIEENQPIGFKKFTATKKSKIEKQLGDKWDVREDARNRFEEVYGSVPSPYNQQLLYPAIQAKVY